MTAQAPPGAASKSFTESIGVEGKLADRLPRDAVRVRRSPGVPLGKRCLDAGASLAQARRET